MNKNIDIYNLKSQEALDVKFFFECKICELSEKYYEYQDLYNAIYKLPLFREKFDNYENKIKELENKLDNLSSFAINGLPVYNDKINENEKKIKKLEDENVKLRRDNLLLEIEVYIKSKVN